MDNIYKEFNKVVSQLSDEETDVLTVSELRESGLLVEMNRRFLHPLGLALAIVTGEDDEDDDNSPVKATIVQSKDKHFEFSDEYLNSGRFKAKQEAFEELLTERYSENMSKRGYHVQQPKLLPFDEQIDMVVDGQHLPTEHVPGVSVKIDSDLKLKEFLGLDTSAHDEVKIEADESLNGFLGLLESGISEIKKGDN